MIFRRWLVAAASLWTLSSFAAGPVVLVDERVAQYREAAAAVKRRLPDATTVDPGDADAAARIAGSSVIVAVGQKAFTLARGEGGGAPVVFCMVLGVTRSSLGANVTGVPIESDPSTVFGDIKLVAPSVKKLGVIFNPDVSELLMDEAKKVAAAQGLSLVLKPIHSAGEVESAVSQLSGGVDAFWLPPDPKLFNREVFAFLLSFASERRLPLFGFLDSFTEAGALASVSPSYDEIGDRAGKLAADIAARADSKHAVPPVAFARGNLTVNLKTASALGINVPSRAVADAKQVYR